MSNLKEVVEGFNSGYIIRLNKPELFKQLMNDLNEIDIPFFRAFKEGGLTYEKELIKNLMLKPSSKNHFLSKENDRDMEEPDLEI